MTIADKPNNSKNVESIYPLSPMQQGMLFHTLYTPESRMYFQHLSCVLQGCLQVPAFEKAWQQVVERHPVLRTAFVWEKRSKPLQVVCKSVKLRWTHYDWSALSLSEQKEHLETFLQVDRTRGFELNQAPLMHFTLIQTAVDAYQFIWSYHHLLIDGWSLPNIVQEVFAFYEVFSRNDDLNLKMPRPYRDYIAWLQKQDNSKTEAFWRQKLAGFIAPTPLSVDRALTNSQTQSSYSEQEIHLPEETTMALQAFARQHQLTLNNLVQGAWALLLSRYSGESDVIFGATVSGRPPDLIGVESMVGLFINTLPIRVKIPEAAELLPWLKALQAQQVELEQYAHTPLADIQGWSDVQRGIALFESIMVFENYPVDESLKQQIAHLNIDDIRSLEQTNFPLTVVASPGKQIHLKISYDTSRLDDGAIARMLGHLQTLLAGFVAKPEQCLSDLSLLTEPERDRLLFEWNDKQAAYSQDLCIHQLFEQQVERNSDTVAVTFEERQLTYGELNARANQLAHHLKSLGVRADTLVGICLERSLEMVISILGILKAGGAYVPLDPTYPQERLSFMLTDSQIRVMLTQSSLQPQLPAHDAEVLCLDSDWPTIALSSSQNPIALSTSANLAYIIYTSGSTGQPKGVAINHANVTRLFASTAEWFHFDSQDVWTLFHSFAFDFSVWEIWGALINGGRLVVVPYWVSRSPEAFYELLCQERVTVLNQTPSAFQQLIQTEQSLTHLDKLALRFVIFGGEALEIQSLKSWFDRHGDEFPQLVNMYGITETTVHVTYRPITLADLRESKGSVIGRPIPDLQVFVLDAQQRLLPIGVPGEMYVGGDGLARDYLNRSELTQARFIPNPFSSDPQARLYKTGDLARYLSNGDLEYLGRIDNQVKIRGFRIELGEIESALSQHQSVLQAVVMAREDIPGTKRLVAYLVCNEQIPTVNDLRRFLQEKLPEHSIPAMFVFLETFPLTPNGKVDRRALHAPDLTRQLEEIVVAPRNLNEQTLAQIWTEVLGIERVGINDNFFALGGDSILSLQIIARANQTGLQLTPKQLFANQTIAELATVVGTSAKIHAEQGLVTGAVPLTPIQQWFFEQQLPELHHYNQSVVLSVSADIKPELLKQVLQQLVLHHDALRLQFDRTDSYWEQQNAGFEETVSLQVVDLSEQLLEVQHAELERIGSELQASLNLSDGSLMRAALFQLGSDKPCRLLLAIHHLAVDGVSWRILLEDLLAAYQQVSCGEAIRLPPKTTSFRYWAQRLNEYAQSSDLLAELDYWRDRADKIIIPLPADKTLGENSTASAATVSISLSTAETQTLLQEVPKAYNTQVNDILLAALALTMREWTGQNLLHLNLEGHGREDLFDEVDLSRTVGWFTTIFPVAIALEDTGNLGDILKSVKEQLRQVPLKGIGYGVLRYLSGDEAIATKLRALSPQIGFNYLGQFDQTLDRTSEFQLTTESIGSTQTLAGQRSHLLDINSFIVEGQIQIDWTYSTNIHESKTIDNLAKLFAQQLRSLIAHCLLPEAGGYTPSDFPLAKLNQSHLDRILTSLSIQSTWKDLEDLYPLSPTQQGMLFHSLYAPDSGVYVELLSCTFRGNLDVTAFEQAWQQAIARHAIFRTAFLWQQDRPLQLVYRQAPLAIATQDWQGLSPNQQQYLLEELLESEQKHGFDLTQAPLMRLYLFPLGSETYQFVWSHHHLLLDGWSLPLILKEVFDRYDAIFAGQTLHYQPVVSYRNYIAWLQQQDMGKAQAYWQQKLQGFAAPTPLNVERPSSNRPHELQEGYGGYDTQQLQLAIATTTALQSFAKQHQLTLNNLVQGAWALLLARYSGESDVVFGATVSGRPPALVGVESIVGLFINTLPMRVEVAGDTQLLPWLKALQVQQVETEQYAYTPLVEIQNWSDVTRGMPLFKSIVVFENYPVDASMKQRKGSLEFSEVRGIEQTNYPLTVGVVLGEQLSLNISYEQSCFDEVTIARMLGHLQMLLEGMVSNPDLPIAQLPLLTAPEQKQLLVDWNDTQVDYPSELCIHHRFEQQVEGTPDAIAVVFAEHHLTYRELNVRSNQLAHHLQALGVETEVLVGICVERSLDMVVGLLGILKAGGAYVPLDPDYPQERLSFMLSDTQVTVLLTQRHLGDKLPEYNAKVIYLDEWRSDIAQNITQQNQENPVSQANSKNLAYINYTSGSTGTPKGVEVCHQGVLRLLFGIDYVCLDAEQRLLQMAPISFDASTFEIWGALLHGGQCVLFPGKIPTTQALSYEIEKHGITTMWLTAALFNSIIDEAPQTLSGIRQLSIGGEALSVTHVRTAIENLSSTQIVNGYGPTESTTFACCYPILSQLTELTELTKSIPIGRPIANTQVYLLDAHLQLVPVGVPGELHIGGDGLARGYLNRSELTQEKFIPNPFSDRPQARLYKTGDLVRYLSDGSIEYIGRIDNQVKIRGFRIELGEIETALLQHDSISQAIAIAREDEPGKKRLVGYIVCHTSQGVTISELRQFLKDRLPEYMLPSAFVFLESLPLTPNGKVDRRALPAPDLTQQLEESFVAPRTEIEQKLAKIWAEVLGVEQVGIRDNFFELGGDSILSLQIVARSNQAGIQLTPKQLFGNQTIAELAAVAGTAQQIEAEQGLVTGEVPLTPIQQWFFEQEQPEPHHYNQSVVLSVPADVHPELIEKVLQQLVLHHDVLRLRFECIDSGWEQFNVEVVEPVTLQVVDLSAKSSEEQQANLEAIGNELQTSLNLSNGPLIQAALFQLGSDRPSRLLLIIHHLAVDGVSWRVLLEDLSNAYQLLCRGDAIQFPLKTTSFKDWAIRLAEYARSDASVAELSYWSNQANKQLPPLPTDNPIGENTVALAITISNSLSTTTTNALLQEVPKAYNTQINDILLAALVLAMHDWTGGSGLRLDLEGHGREDLFDEVDLSRTVGWFTTTFPVVLDLPETKQLGDTLKSVKEQLRSIPNKGVGYGLLRYLSADVEVASQLQNHPSAEISFNYLGQFDQTLDRDSEFQLTTESIGSQQSLTGYRAHLLDINSFIVEGQLQIDWTYSSNIHHAKTIENLAQAFVEQLQALVDHCLSPEAGGFTPSDFPLAQLSQPQLDLVLSGSNNQSFWKDLEDLYPLSPTQQGMVFHSLYAPESGVYVELFNCTLRGNLDVVAFEQAWQQVVDRHVTFRTAFHWQQEQPLQLVYRRANAPLHLQDWCSLVPELQDRQLEALMELEQNQGFDLSQAPLMRLHLIQLSNETYQFLWSYHHLLLDGWSLPLVLKEVFDGYDAFCAGTNLLRQPTVAYREYIAWLQQQDMGKAQTYWQQKLKGFIASTPLNVERSYSVSLRCVANRQTSSSYSEREILLSAETSTAMQSFVRQHQLTLNNLVQGAWALLLAGYSGEPDVVFGATVSGRPPTLVGVESIVGLFINTLPMRVQVAGNTQLLPWLKALQTQQVETEQYAYTPLVEIQNWSDVTRGMPLFESIVVFENYPVDVSLRQRQGSIDVTNVRGIEQTNYPLTVIVVLGEQVSVNISYDQSRFDADSITRMLGHFQMLLEGMVSSPEQPIAKLPLLTPSEQQQLLVDWNDTQADYPSDMCIHQLFEKQVERTPDAIAVVFEEQHLTYRDLNQRSNQLAHYLQTLGVKPEVLVGICVERNLDMVIGMLGILKAGGAYVPLDPNYPQERIAVMLADSQVQVLLTQQHLIETLPEHNAQVIYLDNWEAISQFSDTLCTSEVTLDNLVYVLYTSGSTGKPKGVAIAHRSPVALVSWAREVFTNEQIAGVLASTSICFDLSVFELFVPLSWGGKVILAENALQLTTLSTAEQVTLINTVPSAITELVRVKGIPNGVKTVNLAGEPLQNQLVQQIYQQDNIQQVFNLYGPSEDTTYSTFAAIAKGAIAPPPIGRPISNTQVYILNQNLQPVPIGVPGELHLGGAGLARGYLNRPDLTQERFIANPFSDDLQARLYKTGDLVRYLADGNIEYLGRIDNQVKIRGFRIELGEIEAALSQHSAIVQTVVIAREDVPGTKRLVAYLVCDSEETTQTPTVNDLRQFLKEKLPEYMLPSAFVFLNALPLTPNGKVDRRALPAPEFRPELEESFVFPRTPTEQTLAQIWAEVLGIAQVGIRDNFFELGGDSILSLQIIARANQAGLQLTPKQLFSNQTIAELATVVGTSIKIQAEQGLVIGEVPLTPIQHWFFEQEQPEPHHFNQSVVLSVPADVNPKLLEKAIQHLTLHHDALRLRFERSDSGWEQINADITKPVALQVVDLSAKSPDEQSSESDRIGNELHASLNLADGSLMRSALFQLGSNIPGRLLLIIHHLAVDGVTWRILLGDLLTAYQQISQGEAIQLPPKTTSFRYWAHRIREYVQSDALAAELSYWSEQANIQLPSLPIDNPTGENSIASAATVAVSLDAVETLSLLHEVPKAYNTQVNDILLTALGLAMREWTGSSRLRLDLEGHGREDLFDEVDLSRTVGWFTGIFPVLLALGHTASPQDALKSVKEQLRGIPNKGMGYGLLRYLSGDSEVVSQLQNHPSAEICFNYLGQFDRTLETSSEFQLTAESIGSPQSLVGKRSHLFEINSFIVEGQLLLNWTYSANIHQAATIEQLVEVFLRELRSLIEHCTSPNAGGYTPSDFPLATITQPKLDFLTAGLPNWRELEDMYPLSPTQQGMVFHSLYAPESGVYVELFNCALRGNLDVVAFEQAWQQVCDRHVTFRTAFHWQQEQPLQLVYRRTKTPLHLQDWRSHSEEAQRQQLEALLETEQKQGFDLAQAPLMCLHLIQINSETYQFVWSHHHLLLDGWSLPLVLKEVFDRYESLHIGETLSFGPIVAYREYIAWLQRQDMGKAQTYWQQKLKGFIAPTPLNVERPYSVSLRGVANHQQHGGYDTQQIQLSPETSTAMQSFVRQHQLTLNNLVQGAWALLLAGYSGEPDVVFGATVSGRPPTLVGVESIVGLFINTLPMRVQVAGNTQLLPWLKALQTQQVETEQYAYTPLVEIQNWSDVTRGMPLFESIVVFENYPVDVSLRQRQGSIDVTNVRGIEQTNYPLTVIVVLGEQVSVNISYDQSRFDADSITRMLGHFQMLLEGMVSSPEQPIAKLPLLTPSEQQQLLVNWNDTQADYPCELCIHQLFEQQVEKTPDAIAVVFAEQQLTYRELNQSANQLAHYLQTLGVKPEVLVGICVERNLDMVIGMLGILKAGGAYVPLDPNYPQERLAVMLADSQVQVLLTQQQLVETLPEHNAQVICLNDWEAIAKFSDAPCTSEVTLDNLVYVLYTSGSTGKPKGVAIAQRSPVALVSWAREIFAPEQLAGVLASTSICFDLSVFELFVPLCSGGKVILAENALQLPNLSKAIAQQVTLINTVPSAITELVRVKGIPDGVTTINLAGESLQNQLVQQIYQQDNIQQVFNLYGPSEDTTYSTFAAIAKGASNSPPIGRPISNTQAYILNQNLQPVPIGVPGELHLGGAGLARGYLNRPDLTQERFIANPFSDDLQSRLYKTGDLVRYLPDGNIEYLGRIDNQVKIRGFRIELGEIEAALSQYSAIVQTVVIAREDVPGTKRLVAYLVCDREETLQTPEVNDLRQFLKEKLPEYMLPAAFVFLDALPLTPNGKIDRPALPAPDLAQQLEESFVAARTEVEQRLAKIWAEVLGIEQVGIRDNFFELGGDSILSLQIIARANQAGLPLTPKQLFSNQTIAELATVVGTSIKIQAEQGLVTGAVPLTPIQQWFFEQEQPEPHHFNQSVVLSVPADVNSALLEKAIQHLTLHHDALRLRFDRSESGWEEINADITAPVVLQVVDLSSKSPDEQQDDLEAIGSELQASLNLSDGSLMRAVLFQLGSNVPGRLLLIIHHLVVDGVSWRILLEDLLTAYQQLSQAEAIQLPPKTTSFKEWSIRLTEYAQSAAISSELDYWLTQSGKRLTPLPVDFSLSYESNKVATTSNVSVSLNAEETHALLQEVPSAYNTQINDVLLTALLQSFARWTGERSLWLDLEGHGREELFEDIDVSRTVGWFTTLFPMQVNLEGEKQPDRGLKSIKEQLRRLPNRGIGYGILRYLSPTAAQIQTVSPAAQVRFNYLGQVAQEESHMWQLMQESGGSESSRLGYRSHLLDVSGLVVNGRLQIDWSYSNEIHRRSTIESLAGWFMEALRDLIDHCRSPDAVGFTPSDFSKAGLSQQELDDLIAEID
jgi:amino acid adenylation domain-containing protein/non-ribosomal peptide synthase protein (TIGR01720 family)